VKIDIRFAEDTERGALHLFTYPLLPPFSTLRVCCSAPRSLSWDNGCVEGSSF